MSRSGSPRAKKMDQYKIFIFSSPHNIFRCEVYDWNGALVRSVRANDLEEAKAIAEQYVASLQRSAHDEE